MLAIFLDIETTGLDPTQHRAIDIALKVIDITRGSEVGSYQSIVKISPEMWQKADPHSLEINGYTWESVSLGKPVEIVKEEILSLFKSLGVQRGKAVFICQNPAFDRGFFSQIVDVYTQEKLNWPYHWLDFASMYWTLLSQNVKKEGRSFPEELNLSKNEIARLHNLPPEVDPHKAMNGVNHLIECYKAVLNF